MHQVFRWTDPELEGAHGWVCVESVINGLSASESIVVSPTLTLEELQTIGKANSRMCVVLHPQMGCTVAGICLPHPTVEKTKAAIR